MTIVLVMLVVVEVRSQNSKIDSLKIQLKAASSNEEKVELFGKLASSVWDYDFEQGLQFATEGYELAKKINYRRGEILCCTSLGQYYYFKGIYNKARTYYQLAIRQAGSRSFGEYPALTYNRLGNLFRAQSVFDSATFCYDKALLLYDNNRKYKNRIASVNDNLGTVNISLSNFRVALNYLNKSLRIKETIQDSLELADTWKELGHAYSGLHKYDSAQFYYRKVLMVSNHYHNPELRIVYDIYQGELNYLKGNYNGALTNCIQAIDELKLHDFKKYEAYNLRLIGMVYFDLGNPQQALKYFFEAIKINEQLKAQQELAKLYLSIGWAYIEEGLDSLSMSFASLSLSITKKIKDQWGIASAKNLAGYIFFKGHRYNESLSNYEAALRLRETAGNLVGVSSTLDNIARLYSLQGQYDLALQSQLRSIRIAEQLNDKLSLAPSYNSAGLLLYKMNRLSEAEEYLRKGMQVSMEGLLPKDLLENYRFQADVYQSAGKLSKAVLFYQKFVLLSDSVRKLESTRNIAQMSVIYQLERKEAEIQNLNRKRLLSRSQIELQNAKLAAQENQIRERNLQLIIISVSLIVFMLMAFLNYRSNKRIKRLNYKVTEQNNDLVTSNEEILSQRDLLAEQNDSLQEARKIIEKQNEEIKDKNLSLKRQVKKRTHDLVQYIQQLEQFTFISSHNLRAPVARILGLGNLLELKGINDEDAGMIHHGLISTARELDRVITDLNLILEVKRGNNAVLSLIDLREVLQTIRISLRNEISETNTLILEDFQATAMIKTFRPYIDSILLNLVSNAIKYRRQDRSPIIAISTMMKKKYVCITVSDNGLGIDLKLYGDKLFTLYKRFHDHIEGKGIGLYMVKTQIVSLGGKIKVKSEPNAGTTFSIYLKKDTSPA